MQYSDEVPRLMHNHSHFSVHSRLCRHHCHGLLMICRMGRSFEFGKLR